MTETAHHPMLAEDRVARWLGVTLEAAEKDHARIRMTLTEDQHNGFGLAHGGAVFAFADTCFALTCNDPASDGSTLTVASGVDVNFLAATRAGQTLVAEGRLVAAAGRSAVYDITVTTDDGTPVAAFRGRSRTIPAPGRGPADAPAGAPPSSTAARPRIPRRTPCSRPRSPTRTRRHPCPPPPTAGPRTPRRR